MYLRPLRIAQDAYNIPIKDSKSIILSTIPYFIVVVVESNLSDHDHKLQLHISISSARKHYLRKHSVGTVREDFLTSQNYTKTISYCA